MDNIKMTKLKSGLIRFNGTLSYHSVDYKYVEVDGERYEKRETIEVNTTLAEMRKDESNNPYFQIFEYDFEEISTVLKIEEYTGFSYRRLSDMTYSCYQKSTNNYVKALQCAKENNLLPSEVISVYTDKTNTYPSEIETWNRILETLEVEFFLFSYGFNNGVFYTISLETLFTLPFDKIPKFTQELFFNNGINLRAKNKVNQVVKLINKKVRL